MARWLLGAAAVLGGLLAFYRSADPTAAAQVLGMFTATLSGAICLGGLVFVVVSARPDERGVLDPAAFRTHLVAERLSVVWAVAAVAMVAVQAAADAGVPVGRVLASGQLAAAVGASEAARGWVAAAIFATALAVGLRLTVRWEWHVVLLIPAVVAVVAVPVTGNAGQGPDHDYATSSVIVFALALAVLTGVKIAAVLSPGRQSDRSHPRIVALLAGAVALGYGALLLALMAGPGLLLGSGYGRLGLLAAAALLIGWVIDVRQVRTAGAGGRPAALLSALTAMVSVACVSGMSVQTAPRLLAGQPSIFDILLGYELPGAPTAVRLLTFWRFDTFLGTAGLLLAAAYLVGVARLRRRGDRWPAGRTVSWLAGCLALVLATGSGVRSYGSAMFSIHMVEHMTLNMFVPILLVLGAPVTLALRTLPAAGSGQPPGPREWLLRMIHSRFTGFLSNPITAFVLFVGSLYAVYFTPLFDTLVRYHWGHEFMSLHFMLTGYLFYWGIIGVDPGPRRLPFIGRLGLLFAVMPFHAFFGIAMMSMTSEVGGNFYRGLALPWVPSLNDDQHLGGAIAWGASELPILVVVVALVVQWARQDRRAGERADRHASSGYADDEMEAYNAMLRELAKTRR